MQISNVLLLNSKAMQPLIYLKRKIFILDTYSSDLDASKLCYLTNQLIEQLPHFIFLSDIKEGSFSALPDFPEDLH